MRLVNSQTVVNVSSAEIWSNLVVPDVESKLVGTGGINDHDFCSYCSY